MSQVTKRYMAVYGTLKKGFNNHRLIEQAKLTYKGKAHTLDPEFLLTAGGVPFVHHPIPQDFGELIQVEIYSFDTDEQIKDIDRLEGHPNWYCRKPFDFVMEDGELLTAEMYVMPVAKEDFVSSLVDNPRRWSSSISREDNGKKVGWNYDFNSKSA